MRDGRPHLQRMVLQARWSRRLVLTMTNAMMAFVSVDRRGDVEARNKHKGIFLQRLTVAEFNNKIVRETFNFVRSV